MGRPRFFFRRLGVEGPSLPGEGVDEARRKDAPAGGGICNALTPTLAAAAKAFAGASEDLGTGEKSEGRS
jgi:hypothetical protein